MSKRFEGKVVLVTGAAGGIGRATAERFARDGASVVATDLAGTAIEETAAALAELGAEALTDSHDVTSAQDWQRVVSAAAAKLGGLDFLINNAGIEGAVAPLGDSPDDVFDQVLAVNVKGVFLGMKAAIPEMRKRGGGAIVNLASVAGVIGEPGIGPYVASKHAVIGLTKTAATEYAPVGIRTNAVCPAPVDTRMIHALETALAPGEEAAIRKVIEQRVPMGRYAQPPEIASVIAHLCSDDAAYVNGSICTVDGGMTNY